MFAVVYIIIELLWGLNGSYSAQNNTFVIQELCKEHGFWASSLSLTSLFLSKLTCNPGINFFSLGEYAAAAAAKSLQSCPTLWDPTDGSPPGSPVSGILQARTLEWVAFPSPMHESEVAQSCPTPSDPMDCSLPGSFIHGIFQARVLEWVAIAFSVPVPGTP